MLRNPSISFQTLQSQKQHNADNFISIHSYMTYLQWCHNLHFIRLEQDNFINIFSSTSNPFIITILSRNIIKHDHYAVIHIDDSDINLEKEGLKEKKTDIIRQTIEYKITMVNLEKVLLQRIGSIKGSTIEDTEFMNVHVTSKAKSKEYCRTSWKCLNLIYRNSRSPWCISSCYIMCSTTLLLYRWSW